MTYSSNLVSWMKNTDFGSGGGGGKARGGQLIIAYLVLVAWEVCFCGLHLNSAILYRFVFLPRYLQLLRVLV